MSFTQGLNHKIIMGMIMLAQTPAYLETSRQLQGSNHTSHKTACMVRDQNAIRAGRLCTSNSKKTMLPFIPKEYVLIIPN